jgi:hypothetical protein
VVILLAVITNRTHSPSPLRFATPRPRRSTAGVTRRAQVKANVWSAAVAQWDLFECIVEIPGAELLT